MASTFHSPEDLARFREGGDGAQVWAAWRTDPERNWFYLERGEASPIREFARTELMCPVPDCIAPNISTRGGERRRDHFFHLTEGKRHSDGESLNHLQGKHMLAAWLTTLCPAGTVIEEERSVKDARTRMDRRPDVLATLPDGTRWAIEVEYKSFSLESWRAKDAEYQAAGIRVLWVWGHTRWLPQLPAAYGPSAARFRWRSLTRAMAESGRPVLFVNPIERMIGVAHTVGPPIPDQVWPSVGINGWTKRSELWFEHAGAFGESLTHIAKKVYPEVGVHGLDECRFDLEHGILTPTHDRVLAARADIDEMADRVRRYTEERIAERQGEYADYLAGRQAASLRGRARRQAITRSWAAAPKPRGGPTCSACGDHLADMLVADGKHIGC